MEKKKKSMKLRTRVIISFFIIILVPIVMCALTFYFFVGYKAKIIGEKYGLANATYRTISNNTLLLNAMTSEEYDEVEDTAKSDTAKLEETNYLSVLNARLQKKQSFIAVREDGVIIYNGSEELSSESWKMSCRNTVTRGQIRRAAFISAMKNSGWSNRRTMRTRTEKNAVRLSSPRQTRLRRRLRAW